MSQRLRRLAPVLLLAAAGLLALATATALTLSSDNRAAGVSVGGPFSLVDGDGRPVTDRTVAGAPHLVFFGFTHCPDVCPTTLFQISEVFRAMGEKGRDVRALFVTVDPERDTPAVMKSYVSSFDSRIVPLTGSPEQVAATVKAFRAYSRKVPLKDGDYTMEHTALVYLMNGKGEFVGSFNLERPPEEAARDLLRRT